MSCFSGIGKPGGTTGSIVPIRVGMVDRLASRGVYTVGRGKWQQEMNTSVTVPTHLGRSPVEDRI
jgi:hypothetical protein